MAEAPGDQCLALGLKPVAVPILSANPRVIGALHQAILARHTEAALRAALLAAGFQQLRIHQFKQLGFFRAHIHHNHTPQDAHLRRGQTHAAGIQKGFFHIIQQLVELAVKSSHRLADLVQCRVSGCQNLSKSHLTSLFLYSNPFTSTKADTPRFNLSCWNCRSRLAVTFRSWRVIRHRSVSRYRK